MKSSVDRFGCRVFCSYAHHDEDLKKALESHLAPLVQSGAIANFWSDKKLTAGTEIDSKVREELERSHIILLLLSPEFIESNYCYHVEAQLAMDRHERGEARVVPVLLRPVFWQDTPMRKYLALPKDGRPITSWPNRDEGFLNVVSEIDRVIKEVMANPSMNPQPNQDSGLPSFPREVLHAPQDSSLELFKFSAAIDQRQPLRSAGISEALDDIILTFYGDPGPLRTTDIWVMLNTNITSELTFDPISEAALCVASGLSISHLPTLHQTLHGRNRGANTLVFPHVPLHELALLPQAERKLRLSNIRSNISQLAYSKDGILQIRIAIADVPCSSGDLDVATICPLFEVRLQIPGRYPGSPGFLELSQRRPTNTPLLDHPKGQGVIQASVEFRGKIAGFESIRGRRTRLMLRFNGIPSGVSLFVTNVEVSSNPRTLNGTLVKTDSSGAGPFVRQAFEGEASFSGKSFPISEVALVGGSGYAVWEIEDAGPEDQQVISFGAAVAFLSKPEVNAPGLGSGWITASFAPLSTVFTMSSTAPVPRFVDTPIRCQLLIVNP